MTGGKQIPLGNDKQQEARVGPPVVLDEENLLQ
jgi:hypothetical protein